MIEEETLRGFGTRAVRGGKKYLDPQTGCVNVPIITSTTYGQAAPGIKKGLEDPCTYGGGYEYSRTANPTRGTLEQTLADLEFGKHALTYASGLASITAVTHLVKTNEQILCIDDVYGGTQRYFRHIVTPNYGINVTFLDLTDLELVRSKMNQDTRMIWVETPTNPTLKMADIQELAKIAHEYNAFLVVDNTFLTPYFQNPLKLGADIVIHSITKYLSGHSDVIMGCAITNNKDIFTKLKYIQNTMGAIPSPFDCYLVMRGIKTLHLRMKEHAKNAQLLAEFMEKHPLVQKVYYPGLPSHPQYHIGKKQINEGGFGGMITFYIKGGKKEANTFLEKLEIFTCAESLGGVESLAESPAIMTHASVNEQQRRELGISDTLIRLSVGIEDINDIIHDIDQALHATTKQ